MPAGWRERIRQIPARATDQHSTPFGRYTASLLDSQHSFPRTGSTSDEEPIILFHRVEDVVLFRCQSEELLINTLRRVPERRAKIEVSPKRINNLSPAIFIQGHLSRWVLYRCLIDHPLKKSIDGMTRVAKVVHDV
jgi:hypothetical protein